MKRLLSLLLLQLCLLTVAAQGSRAPKEGWHLLDPAEEGYMGISLEKAYELLRGRKPATVVVAVIDSGIDTAHQDLQAVLWRNPREIAGNGKDDDGNGYTDDVHGWNFCGSPSGENLSRNTYEIARVYHNWKKEFEGKEEKHIPADKKFLYRQWVKAATIIEQDHDAAARELPSISNFLNALEASTKTLTQYLDVDNFGPAHLASIRQSPSELITRCVNLWTELFSRTTDTAIRNTAVIAEVSDYKARLENNIRRKTDKPDEFRAALVKDRYTDINDRFYGNNNLKSHSGDHGTLVAGVIGAVRKNGLGMDGIADAVRIMAIRAVPGGDEHDKDVALAIRYAVDNGAQVINMSFGKPVSPYKQMVDEAVKYAASKGVLLVHGSGNDGKDISKDVFYPNPQFIDGTRATNFITVGASGDVSTGDYAAPFSNYSREWVDIFAPGMFIYSTATDNRYNGADGTSLAAPVVSGVAALLKSYFPKLTPTELITIITTSGTPVRGEVTLPGDEKKVSFAALSSSGKIVNAYEAVKLALELEKNAKTF